MAVLRPNPHKAEGMELLVEATCLANLSDKRAITSFMRRVVKRTGLHMVHYYCHVFPNGHLTLKDRLLFRHREPTGFGPGITAAGVLAESHITLRTRPEQRRLDLDLFSCRMFEADVVEDMLTAAFMVKAYHRWDVIYR